MRAFLIGITLLITTGFILPALAEVKKVIPFETENWQEKYCQAIKKDLIKKYDVDLSFEFKQKPLNYVLFEYGHPNRFGSHLVTKNSIHNSLWDIPLLDGAEVICKLIVDEETKTIFKCTYPDGKNCCLNVYETEGSGVSHSSYKDETAYQKRVIRYKNHSSFYDIEACRLNKKE